MIFSWILFFFYLVHELIISYAELRELKILALYKGNMPYYIFKEDSL
jgi:hypothetical protein